MWLSLSPCFHSVPVNENESYRDDGDYSISLTHTEKEISRPGVYLWNTVTKHPSAYFENELYHFSVDQTMNRFPVDVGDEVTSAQTRLMGGAAILNVLFTKQLSASQGHK